MNLQSPESIPPTTTCKLCTGLANLKSFVCPVWRPREPREHNRIVGERQMYYYECTGCGREFYNKDVIVYNDAKAREILRFAVDKQGNFH